MCRAFVAMQLQLFIQLVNAVIKHYELCCLI
jgi:hypothetical protein